MWLFSKNILVKDSGLLDGFCDYHCHLLPGVDDGVQDMEQTFHILDLLESLGVCEIWMTPHIMEDYPNEPDRLKELFSNVKHLFSGNIKLNLAAENMLDGIFIKRLQNNNLLCFGNKDLLIETSYYMPPMNMQLVIDKIKEKGYRPILAHPERYEYMRQDDYLHWKHDGVLLQLNLPSLVGAYGPGVQSKAEWLLNNGMYDCSGTDCHSADQMDFFLDSPINKRMLKKALRLKQFTESSQQTI